jgi:hypothetical protein
LLQQIFPSQPAKVNAASAVVRKSRICDVTSLLLMRSCRELGSREGSELSEAGTIYG